MASLSLAQQSRNIPSTQQTLELLHEEGGALLTSMDSACSLALDLGERRVSFEGSKVRYLALEAGVDMSAWSIEASCEALPPQVVLFAGEASAYVGDAPDHYWDSLEDLLEEASAQGAQQPGERVSALLTSQ